MSLRSHLPRPRASWRAAALGIPALVVAAFVACSPSIGDKCTISTDCSQLGDRLCDTTQPDGYCTVFNCEPDQCPDAICVAYDPTLDPACGSSAQGRSPRFERTFCLEPCSSTSDCRDQYECVDLSQTANQILRRARVVDLGAADGGLGFSVCMASTCGDGIKDAKETDVDCGGNVCNACANQKSCSVPSDCLSSTCSNGTCVAPTCTDGLKDGNETDVDCGGPDCAPCAEKGQGCMTGSDCASGICNAGSMSSGGCAEGNCKSGTQDGAETDVDCGGGGCPGCQTGQKCHGGGDCQSGICTPEGACAPPTAPPLCSLPANDGGFPWDEADAGDGG